MICVVRLTVGENNNEMFVYNLVKREVKRKIACLVWNFNMKGDIGFIEVQMGHVSLKGVARFTVEKVIMKCLLVIL